jgi:hypothetical protein
MLNNNVNTFPKIEKRRILSIYTSDEVTVSIQNENNKTVWERKRGRHWSASFWLAILFSSSNENSGGPLWMCRLGERQGKLKCGNHLPINSNLQKTVAVAELPVKCTNFHQNR